MDWCSDGPKYDDVYGLLFIYILNKLAFRIVLVRNNKRFVNKTELG